MTTKVPERASLSSRPHADRSLSVPFTASQQDGARRAGISIGFQVWAQNVTWSDLMDAGQNIDSAGFSSLWSNDHFIPLVAGVGGVVESLEGPVFDGWSVLGGWAAVTSSVRLGCLVSAVAYRHPALLVKLATALDHASAGRATLGIGAGWFAREHRAFGFEFPAVRERLDRLEESAAICRALLDGKTVSVGGRWFRALEARNDPPPVQDRLPLLIGGSGERRTLRVVAEFADVWSADGDDAAAIVRKRAVLAEHCRAVGRDPGEIRITTGQPPPLVRGDREEAVSTLADILSHHGLPPVEAVRTAAMSPFVGTVEDVASHLMALRDAGVAEVMFDWPPPFDARTLDALANPVMTRLAQG